MKLTENVLSRVRMWMQHRQQAARDSSPSAVDPYIMPPRQWWEYGDEPPAYEELFSSEYEVQG